MSDDLIKRLTDQANTSCAHRSEDENDELFLEAAAEITGLRDCIAKLAPVTPECAVAPREATDEQVLEGWRVANQGVNVMGIVTDEVCASIYRAMIRALDGNS